MKIRTLGIEKDINFLCDKFHIAIFSYDYQDIYRLQGTGLVLLNSCFKSKYLRHNRWLGPHVQSEPPKTVGWVSRH